MSKCCDIAEVGRKLRCTGPTFGRMPTKSSFFWPLRLIAIGTLVLPALVFSYSAWRTFQDVDSQAQERLERALAVLNEHSQKAFQTVERAISEVNEVLRDRSDEWIRENESDLFLRFKRTQQTLPQIESIWAFDRNGHPLVSSTILPVPRSLNNSDRSYFKTQKNSFPATFISEVVRAKIGSLSFFVVSGQRLDERGDFNGVIGVTVMPQHFSEFYQKLSRGSDSFVLLRTDGVVLARYPAAQFEGTVIPAQVAASFKKNPEQGVGTTVSLIDGIERRVSYRKVPDFPLYVASGIETRALKQQFWTIIITNFVLGLPVVLAFFVLSLYAMRRAERFQKETARREAAESALKQARRLEAMGQLTGGVAHDFNNLLMVIEGNLQRLKRSVTGATLPPRSVEAIETAVKRGADLTRQLLSFARRQTHEAKVIDLHHRLPLIRDMLQSSLRGDILISLEIPGDLWRTKLDPSELELALLNLAVNARDAMTNGGRLTLSARNVSLSEPNEMGLEGHFIALMVADTGAGISAQVIDRVFEPFFTTKDVGKGTGLGLSQVYGFAQQAGGAVKIESEVGRGTTVVLYLPRCAEEGEAEAPVREPAGTSLTNKGHSLLVEDNAEVAAVTRGLLEDLGYAVTAVFDVPSALQRMKEIGNIVDVVVSDVVMPGGSNGLDLARQIRREHGSRIPIVLMTGYSENAQAASSEGFKILRKPFGAEDLKEALAPQDESHR